ncbi:hypothetical protein BDM02DRAFT_3114528 [Thelephora ganbajun]|uniref:Uncharacterized protein n=1 Tax=Thelephora ganbajun TaxID=370292 RepID=A0ACB6ZHS2_THEGA|nr:hypothetical protein BDM02DRAFT_3114528 [Thelephora ganbajun]
MTSRIVLSRPVPIAIESDETNAITYPQLGVYTVPTSGQTMDIECLNAGRSWAQWRA